ncbi:MAG: hypothetical protein RL591_2182 [Planctomycetota bacterium]|jgi:hypothetical protein
MLARRKLRRLSKLVGGDFALELKQFSGNFFAWFFLPHFSKRKSQGSRVGSKQSRGTRTGRSTLLKCSMHNEFGAEFRKVIWESAHEV